MSEQSLIAERVEGADRQPQLRAQQESEAEGPHGAGSIGGLSVARRLPRRLTGKVVK